MHRDLPPFAALRAFEASARRGSFKDAAEELCITQSAVSHRIKELEDYIGCSLFHRQARGVELTERGRNYFAELGDVMDRIETATASARRWPHVNRIALRGTPAFINRWLVPRLATFAMRFPNIELHLATSIACADFAAHDVDISVEWGVTARDGANVVPFFETTSYPVASPALIRRVGALRHPRDLGRVTLLHNETGDHWPQWLAAAGGAGVDASAGPRFEHCDLTLSAAVEGQGAALCYDALCVADIAAGRLVRLFDLELPPRAIYSIAVPTGRAKRPNVAAVRDWLLSEASLQTTACAPAAE
jgi:LysR family glycine cleavage system transcriptional activator